MSAVTELAIAVGTSAACQVLWMPRASYYGQRRKAAAPAVASRFADARALHLTSAKPELFRQSTLELGYNQATGPANTYFYLYVILDVFSRYVTGWMVAYRESAELAKRLIEESCKKQQIQPGQLT